MNGNIAANKDGAVIVKRTYNKKKQVVKEEYRNADNKRAIHSRLGYCIVEKEYDDAGNVSHESYFGTDKNPLQLKDGDKEETVETPFTLVKGYASLNRTYDDAGNVLVETYFDKDGAETACADGYSRWVRTYNENKKVTSESFLDASENPVLKKSTGYARVEYTYDDNGNKLSELYYNTDGEPAAGQQKAVPVCSIPMMKTTSVPKKSMWTLTVNRCSWQQAMPESHVSNT